MSPSPEPTTAPRSRYSMGSGANMARSLFVVLLLIAGLIAIVPRVGEVRQPAVDAASVVAYAVKESGTSLLFPADLPAGWTATSARFSASIDRLPTWQAGWTTPSGQFVSIKQAQGAGAGWLRVATIDATVTGTVDVGGRTWEVRTDDRGQIHLVALSADRMTTVISSTTPTDAPELRTFIERLTPAAPAG